jgi:hypothetical protein
MLVYRIILFVFIVSASSGASVAVPIIPKFRETNLSQYSELHDTIKENQVLYNGRIWKNIYHNVEGDQFLFTKSFLPGSVSIRGYQFSDLSIMYDIFNDEILIPFSKGGVLQVNKQMVDSFTIVFLNKKYHFTKLQIDSLDSFVNTIYKGKSALYIRYTKKIEKSADQGKYDQFYQVNQTLFVKDNKLYPIKGKRDLLNALQDDNESVKDYIKKNRIKITAKDPESFVPVIRYFDSINH